jgi:hypothetical protein
MSDEDQLSPAERELETALRSLRPRAARIDAEAASGAAGRIVAGRVRAAGWLRHWHVPAVAAAAALAVAGGAWLALRHGRAGHHDFVRKSPTVEPQVVAIEGQVAPPTLRAYRQALDKSPAELNALLGRQALVGGSLENHRAPISAVSLWGADLNSISGDM